MPAVVWWDQEAGCSDGKDYVEPFFFWIVQHEVQRRIRESQDCWCSEAAWNRTLLVAFG